MVPEDDLDMFRRTLAALCCHLFESEDIDMREHLQ